MTNLSRADQRATMLATAERASASLSQSVTGKPAETVIETNVQSLSGLARVMKVLLEDARACGGVDCMGRTVDGTKLWVTRDRLEAVEQRAQRYEAALRSIASTCADDAGEMDMLVDWQGTARALSALARQTLA